MCVVCVFGGGGGNFVKGYVWAGLCEFGWAGGWCVLGGVGGGGAGGGGGAPNCVQGYVWAGLCECGWVDGWVQGSVWTSVGCAQRMEYF